MARNLLALTVAFLVITGTGLFGQQPLARSLQIKGFVIYSPDRQTRSLLARHAQTAAKEWEEITGDKVMASTPIIIVDKTHEAKPRGAKGASCHLFEIEDGRLKVQIDVLDDWAMKAGYFETEVIRALALQAMHRKNPPKAGKNYAQPPGWLVEGIGEQIRRRGGTVPDGVHAALIQSERPPALGDFLQQKTDRLDATSLLLYRAQALALLKALSDSKNSKPQFLAYLENPDGMNSDPAKLLEAFPNAAPDVSSLNKIWTLSLARSSMPPRLASLSVDKTDEELTEILALEVPADPKKTNSTATSGPMALPLAARDQGGAFLMRQRSVDLLNLEFRAHPLLVPIVEEYRNIAMLLSAKPKSNVGHRIEEIEKIRVLLVERHKAISDYMNWFEATQVDESNSSLAEETRPNPVPPRRDPITLHMDAIERRGW